MRLTTWHGHAFAPKVEPQDGYLIAREWKSLCGGHSVATRGFQSQGGLAALNRLVTCRGCLAGMAALRVPAKARALAWGCRMLRGSMTTLDGDGVTHRGRWASWAFQGALGFYEDVIQTDCGSRWFARRRHVTSRTSGARVTCLACLAEKSR